MLAVMGSTPNWVSRYLGRKGKRALGRKVMAHMANVVHRYTTLVPRLRELLGTSETQKDGLIADYNM